MKYIHILVTGKVEECRELRAIALVFNECNDLEISESIQYPIEFSKEDIKNLITPNTLDYSVVVDWVGGRPNDR